MSRSGPNPAELARQIDQAAEDLDRWQNTFPGYGLEKIENAIQDPNLEEIETHIEVLCRYPEAKEAIKLVSRETKDFLEFYLAALIDEEGKTEFQEVLNVLKENPGNR